MPLPPPEESEDDIDLDAPTVPIVAALAEGSGPIAVPRFVPEPITPRWAVIAVGILAAAAFALGAALALG